eukprot:TRINITY_DN4627_c0_g1_i1.p1 TRINITY_DN4627_c0_g1~~TRINITY_DN4627_c0_g1_i1.p1  ORF type:complete len:120 (+),score=37.48 TRINITY_DN4627_c0_g1_i1:54-413(+)
MGKETILEDVEKWFFENDEFADTMEKFARDNCDIFSVEDGEQKLEYTTVYNQFKDLFEKCLEDFVKSQGVDLDEFYNLARESHAKNPDGDTPFKWIVATSDYEVFLQMMQDEKRKKQDG